ncbi:MAG: UDP-N-acetylglucosamine pyrophosphorylase [Proteobacteria bacterium]|nr:UDP-N-acetylglucosamine pyrophosphorylase [Pseudomonadota bacterium]
MKLTGPHDPAALRERGLELPDPASVYVDRTVRLERLEPGAALYPGARLVGAKTYVAAGAVVGSEGPATLVDSVLDAGCEVGSGYVAGSVLLPRAKLGGSTHVRPATLLEEEASVAHAVGLKHTILLSYVTLGSIINACDLLVAGGRSRDEHSEVGSGFIHFNFTPAGVRGDKATPSLVGDVVQGVFLREERIFVGGLSGLVGPRSVGYGAVTAAGQILRSDVAAGRLVHAGVRQVDTSYDRASRPTRSEAKVEANLRYVGQLAALRAWYRQVRQVRRAHPDSAAGEARPETLEAAVDVFDAGLQERLKRLADYCGGRQTIDVAALVADESVAPAGLVEHEPGLPHLAWVRTLSAEQLAAGSAWLAAIADAAARRLRRAL